MSFDFVTLPDLNSCLRQLISQVPRGRVATRGDLAEALGNPIAARWVGHFLAHHEHDEKCVCHRIILSTGELGQYATGSVAEKAERLSKENIVIQHGKIDLKRYRFCNFQSNQPLKILASFQELLCRKIDIRARQKIPKYVAGVDVAYPNSYEGQAAYTLVETASGELTWSCVIRRPVRFPYITSYLSFREIPLILELLEEVSAAGQMADVLMVDGTGILHPRQAGIASHLGVAASVATIGITKKLLCGQVDIKNMCAGEARPIVFHDQVLGIALRPTASSRRPIFISPGHRLDLGFSEKLVRLLLIGRRLPEPIYWADRLSRQN